MVRKNSRSPRFILAQFLVSRPPRQAAGPRHVACGNCGNYKIVPTGPCWSARLAYRLRKLRKTPPWSARPIPREKRGWCGKVGNPFFPYIDTKVIGDACDSNAGIADGDTSHGVRSTMACFYCLSTERKKSLVDSRSSTRIASGSPHNFQDARSNPASRLSHPATTRAPRLVQREKMARKPSSSAARRQSGPAGICGLYGAHLSGQGMAKPREPSENFQCFQCAKATTPRHWCLLIPAFCAPQF